MDPSIAAYTLYIHKLLYQRILDSMESRQETIRELLAATRPDLSPQAAACVAESVPAMLPDLHRKWIGMFVEKLLATADMRQVATLCDGSEENSAALALAYVMFLESERMEAQIAQDLADVERQGGADMARVAADLCARLTRVEQEILDQRRQKAEQYRMAKGSDTTH
uniref:Uncharacterized protein n=1 Tax=Fundidesulfovibrio putealis TaxID=270496 RepID=A0A7C4AA88_9BACT